MKLCPFIVSVGLLWACNAVDGPATGTPGADGGSSSHPASDGGASVAAFVDGIYELRVDRTWKGDAAMPRLPTDPLDEGDYVPDASGTTYRLEVQARHTRIIIGDEPLMAELTGEASAMLTYELGSGAFAGGRFLVWSTAKGLQGELTLYGSGVPIAKSERGAVVAVKPANR